MGMEDLKSTQEERAAMRADLVDALKAGAWGMSSGIAYVPGIFADVDEIVDGLKRLEPGAILLFQHPRVQALGWRVVERRSFGKPNVHERMLIFR
jgi:N-acyl-D-aspartate/D-glutamate deacylase